MKIKQIIMHDQISSSTNKNVCCEIHLVNGVIGTSFVSLSRLNNDLRIKNELLDVAQIIKHVEEKISPVFEGKGADLIECDALLDQLYKNDTLSLIPFCLVNAFSVAIARAIVQAERIELFELFAELTHNETVTIPYPFFHLYNKAIFQKHFFLKNIFLLPLGARSFRDSLHSFDKMKNLINSEKVTLDKNTQPEKILEALYQLLDNSKMGDIFSSGIYTNADVLYNFQSADYKWIEENKTCEELLFFYKNIIENYGVFSIQNGFSQQDVLGARTLLETYGDQIQLISNKKLVYDDMPALEEIRSYANACVVNPYNYLTVTKALTHVMRIKQKDMNVIVVDELEQDVSFIVDFAVGTSAGQIKTEEYQTEGVFNRLVEIEDLMIFSLLHPQ